MEEDYAPPQCCAAYHLLSAACIRLRALRDDTMLTHDRVQGSGLDLARTASFIPVLG
jgi:hypothetical protein